MKNKTIEKIYIKFRMSLIFSDVFWDKMGYYMDSGKSLKESYLRARYKANLSIDWKFYNGGYVYE